MKTFKEYGEQRYDELFSWLGQKLLGGKKPQPQPETKPETPYQRYLRMAGKVPGVLPDETPKDDKEADYFKRWERGA